MPVLEFAVFFSALPFPLVAFVIADPAGGRRHRRQECFAAMIEQ